ncbi:MAG: HAD hydrolase-like protein [Microgenomates group bacterium]
MKLILFDIDGTLVSQDGAATFEMVPHGESKFSYAIRTVFGKSVHVDMTKFNGFVDRSILWFCAESVGIKRSDFERELPRLASEMHQYIVSSTPADTTLYHSIASAKQFVDLVVASKTIAYGVLSGNVQSIGLWKLDKAGYGHMFDFGVYGEDADDRIELAKKTVVRADAFFHTSFSPRDISVIGDTVHDVRCGKAIGAHTIAVMTGRHHDPVVLDAEHPDFLVDTLMDNSVLDYFGLKKV